MDKFRYEGAGRQVYSENFVDGGVRPRELGIDGDLPYSAAGSGRYGASQTTRGGVYKVEKFRGDYGGSERGGSGVRGGGVFGGGALGKPVRI